jgi:hypothetical protein
VRRLWISLWISFLFLSACRELNVGGRVYTDNIERKGKEKMYPDSELTPCPECNSLGMTAPNIWGKMEFVHKIPSPRLEGYFTFTEQHQG